MSHYPRSRSHPFLLYPPLFFVTILSGIIREKWRKPRNILYGLMLFDTRNMGQTLPLNLGPDLFTVALI